MVIFILKIRPESDGRLFGQTFLDNTFQIRKRSSADEQDILRIHRRKRHHSILAVGAYRYLYVASFQQFEHSLLYGLTAYIPLAGVLLLGNLVNLIDKDDSLFCFLYIIFSCCQKFGYDAFYIISNIACLR